MMGSWIFVVLVVIPGGGTWKVTLENQCALKGTSAVIKCEYDYPSYQSVTSVYWTKYSYVDGRLKESRLSLSSDNRIKYVGDFQRNCNLEINNVQDTDAGMYRFSFETWWDRWTSKQLARLSVTDMIADVKPTTVAEGNTVNLSCRLPRCSKQTDFVWFRDGQPVTEPVFKAGREDAGRYYCAVRGQEKVRSPSVALNVQYPPMNMTVSMDPQDDVMEGSGVNLTCSSVANPAADNYTWYRRTPSSPRSSSQLVQVGSGEMLSLPSVEASQAGLYLCRARNQLGENNSTALLLTVRREQNEGLSVQILSGIGVALLAALVITLLLFWMRRKTHTEEKVVFNTGLSGKGPSYSSSEDQSDSVYANVMVSSSPSPEAQDLTSRDNSNEEIYVNVEKEHESSICSHEDEVIYTTVTIKPRNPSLSRHKKNSKAPRDSGSTAGEDDSSVIYAPIVTNPAKSD